MDLGREQDRGRGREREGIKSERQSMAEKGFGAGVIDLTVGQVFMRT